jgi:hypothetical protein
VIDEGVVATNVQKIPRVVFGGLCFHLVTYFVLINGTANTRGFGAQARLCSSLSPNPSPDLDQLQRTNIDTGMYRSTQLDLYRTDGVLSLAAAADPFAWDY